MIKNSLRYSLLLGFLPCSLFAGTVGPAVSPSDWTWLGTFSLGPVWEHAGTTQTLFLTPDIEKTYVASKATSALFDSEVFLGGEKRGFSLWHSQFGLAVGATSNADLSGVIWDDGLPEFNNYTYQYKIQHTYVAAKTKWLAEVNEWWMPWVSASIGLAFNTAFSFENTPTIFEALPSPNFSSHMTTSFTYTLGAGIQKILTPHWQVGVGYEFSDWGRSQLGRATGQTQNNGLALSHLYTNGFLVNFTYKY